MAVRKPPHLTRRGDVYYFRRPFPRDLQPRLRRAEISVSLRTRDPRRARLLAAQGVVCIQRLCAKVRTMSHPSEDQIRELVAAFGRELLASSPAPGPIGTGRQEDDRDWIGSTVQDAVAALRGAIEQDAYFGESDHPVDEAAGRVQDRARAIASANGFDVDALPDGARLMLLQGVARALIEEHQQLLHRMDDRITPYAPTDPLFQLAGAPVSPAAAPTVVQGVRLGDAIDAYVAAKKNVAWANKTAVDYERVLRWAREHFGADTPLAAVTKEHVREWRDLILQVRKHAPPSAPFKSTRTSIVKAQVSRKTARKHFGVLAAAFSWWADEGFIDASPVGKITVSTPKSTPGVSRSPFKPEELKALFSSPMYVGCASASRRMARSAYRFRDAGLAEHTGDQPDDAGCGEVARSAFADGAK